jgi:uncharacterized membrane protein YbhN (UPF0104 family)
MDRSLQRGLWQFVVGVLVVVVAASIYADIGPLLSALSAFDWWLLPVVLGLTLGNQALRYLKWEYLLGELAIDVPTGESVQIFGSGLIMILTPGKLGEVWKAWLVRDCTGTPVEETMPVIAIERVTDLLAVLLISLVGVLVLGYSPTVFFALALGLVAAVAALRHPAVGDRLLALLRVLPVVGRKADALETLYHNARQLLAVRPLGVTTALSVCSWGLECVGLWLVLQGLGVDVGVLAAAFVFAVSSILGAVSLLPGGVGVTDGSMIGLLAVFGVDRGAAVSATLIVRAATLWFVAVLAVVVYLRYTARTATAVEEVHNS